MSLEECEFIGHKLGFDPLSLKACLHYLRKYHIISFYNVLSHVIFGSCQVILDKITGFVTYSLAVKKGDRPLLGFQRKFHQQGILSLKILQSEACSKHYKRNLFTPDDLLVILKSLLIITEVGEGEYLMPYVLEVSDIYPSSPVPEGKIRSSFVLHFSKKSPMIGIYCCTISYLMTKAGWKLLTEDGEAVQVARNSVAFKMLKSLLGNITFLDPLSLYLEVAVELPEIVANVDSSFYCQIGDIFIPAMKQAMQTLNYDVRTPEVSFLCPDQGASCSTYSHIAIVNDSHTFLTCSINPGSIVHPLTQDQKHWLSTSKDGEHNVT